MITRYNIGDKIRPIDRLGHSYRVVARYYCDNDIARETWVMHSQDTLPVYDYCLVNCDTGLLDHLLITHADNDGIMPQEGYVNHAIMLDDCMPVKLVCCHPAQAKLTYPFWSDIIMGNWSSDTFVNWMDGILYICSDTSIQ